MKAFLDVSEVLLDPTLVDSFTVRRRAETVNEFGESTMSIVVIPNVIGVITSYFDNSLNRLDDREFMKRELSVVTRFRLQGPSPGFQPDTILWNGNEFLVKKVEPYTSFGFGFIQAIVGSMDAQDQPPVD